jgi:hypothetical protein
MCVPQGMRRDPRLMKAQSLTLPPEQLDECSIAQGLVTLLATAPDKEQMRRACVRRAFVQHIRANSGQGRRLVKIDDPLDGRLRARPFGWSVRYLTVTRRRPYCTSSRCKLSTSPGRNPPWSISKNKALSRRRVNAPKSFATCSSVRGRGSRWAIRTRTTRLTGRCFVVRLRKGVYLGTTRAVATSGIFRSGFPRRKQHR